MRKNQKGFTLVELIIAVAILAIVMLAVGGFIVVGSRSYTSANTDIMLQQEAQLALNQISDVIIDTTDSINYGNGTENVLKDSEFSSEPDEKILMVVNKKDGNNDNDSYLFEWSKDTGTIYFNTSDTVVDDAHPKPDFVTAKRAILAQHVKELHIDISQFEENRVVMVSMTFENGNREYTTSNNVTVRNRIALNKIDVDPMKKAEEFTITTVQNITLEPGDNFDLGDIVQVYTTSGDDEVEWIMVDTGTVIPNGQLSIGTSETRQSFLVRVRRVNEEYANQNDKVAKTVKVNIKRVKSVDLTCSETTIKAGDTVTVNGSASGYMLGNSCEAHSCLSDDESKDHDLVPNRWRIVRGSATIETSDEREVKIKIASTAKAGDEIEIEAISDLSTRKLYGEVTGKLILKVTKGGTGGLTLKSGFKFGTHDDPGPLDYMRNNLKTDYWQYVMCVRVRETNSTNALDDQVVMYHTDGSNLRFFPDLFGLELNRDYYVFFQVIDPVSIETRQKKANNEIYSYYEDAKEVVVEEYLNNIDPDTGKYIGNKYEVSDLYGGLLSMPKITIGYNGIVYPNNNTDYFETYSFYTINGQGNETVMERPWLGDVENVTRNGVLNDIKYTVYKGEGDDPAGWERIYGFNAETMQYDSGSNTLPGGAVSIETGSQFLKWDRNKSNSNLQETCGTYHIVPGFVYANNPRIAIYDYIYRSDNVRDDYAPHYYEQPECTITLKISLGFNMELIPENNEKRWCIFPAPADPKFPFKEITGEQTSRQNFAVYSESGSKIRDFWSIPVKCTYDSGVYKITFTLEAWDVAPVTYTYTCKAGESQWTLKSVVK